MADNPQICSRCGSELNANSLFCPNCGQRVSDMAPMYPPTQKMPEPEPYSNVPSFNATLPPVPPPPAPPAYSSNLPGASGYSDSGGYSDTTGGIAPAGYSGEISYTGPAEATTAKKRNPLLIAAGIIVGLCICCAVVGGGGYFLFSDAIDEVLATFTPEPTATSAPTATTPPTATTVSIVPPVVEPTNPVIIAEPTEGGPSGNNKYSDNPFFDDFSTDRNWPVVGPADSSEYSVGRIGEIYSIRVLVPSTQAWVFAPTSYEPNNLEFDAQIPTNYAGIHGGTFGVLCNYVDGDNYEEIELDPFNDAYAIARVVNDERQPLTTDSWMDFNGFNKGAGAVNHVLVGCEGNLITVFVNDQLVVSIEDPLTTFDPANRMGITVSTYKELDIGGFEIWFDNFSAWVPVQ